MPDIFKAIEKLIWLNIDQMLEFFEKNGWTELDFLQREFTKHTDYDQFFLGSNKNNKGVCINCNAVVIHVDVDGVTIVTFNENG